jgi:maleate cis-trans isomerase
MKRKTIRTARIPVIRVTQETLDKIEKLCEEQDRSLGWMSNHLIEEGLKTILP